MKILKLSPYYAPEQISSTHLSKDLSEAFIKAGIITENFVPTPTRGVSDEVRNKYKKMKLETSADGKIIVHRFAMFREGKNPILRALRYFLVNFIQYFKGSKAKDIDVIYTGSTPPTQGVLCGLVKKRLKVPFVYNLQDIFPDSLVNGGFTKEGSLIWKIGKKVEAFTYKNADRIIVISNDMKKTVADRGVPQDKIVVIPNWINSDMVYPIPRSENYLFDEFSLDRSKFYVVYAGNLGYAQNIDLLLEAALELKNNTGIEFVLFGKGALEEHVKTYVETNNLNNVKLLPFQPVEKVAYVYGVGSVSVVACKKGFGNGAMPSKTWSIMASGIPVLASFDHGSELNRIITENELGLFCNAEDLSEFVNSILQLYNNEQLRQKLGDNARRYVVDNLSRERCTKMVVDLLKNVKEEHDHVR